MHEISNNVVYETSKASDQPAHTLLTEHHLECLSLKGAAEAHLSLHMSKHHIVRNLMHWLIWSYIEFCLLDKGNGPPSIHHRLLSIHIFKKVYY